MSAAWGTGVLVPLGVQAAVAAVWAALAAWQWIIQRRSAGPARSWAPADRLLLAACICASGMGLAEMLWLLEPSWLLAALSAALDLLSNLALCGFLLLLSHEPETERQGVLRSRRAWAFMTIALVTLVTVAQDLALQAKGSRPLHGPAQGLALLAHLGLALFMVMLLERIWRRSGSTRRWHLKPLWIALWLLVGLDIHLLLESMLSGHLSEQGSILQSLGLLLAAPLMANGLKRWRGAPSTLRLSHAAAYYGLSLLLVSSYLVMATAATSHVRRFGAPWGEVLQVVLMLAALGLAGYAMASSGLRNRLRVLVSKHFFRYRYDYREEWLRFTAHLSAGTDPRDLGRRVVAALAGLVQADRGALWLAETDGVMRPLARQGWSDGAPGFEVSAGEPLAAFLERSGWVIDLVEWRRHPHRYRDLKMPEWLQDLPQARLVVPLGTAGRLAGFAVLGQPAAALTVDWEIRDLLKTAGAQAASYLVQMQATEQLLDARKFEAFNRMSAFVVHDIKNIVTQLALMTRNAQRLRDNPAFQMDMIETVEQALEKMRRLLVQLREGAPSAGMLLGGVELDPLLRRLQQRAQTRGRQVSIRRSERLATRGDDHRLERVLGHLVDNALEATPPDRAVWLSLWRDSGSVCVEVGDEGHGMSESFIREQLFRPFSSTKPAGMGLGLHESVQYIRELGGRLDVQSSPGQGTRMIARLPALEIETQSVLSSPPSLAA